MMAVAMSVDTDTLGESARAAQIKRLLSKALLECLEIDYEAGIEIINSYRKDWLPVMEVKDPGQIRTFDEYFIVRRASAGTQ